jgi:hypothetical protein
LAIDADDLLLIPIIIPQFALQAEFPDLDSEDSEGKKTGKDITGTDIESQNQETEAQALVSFKKYMPPPLIYF